MKIFKEGYGKKKRQNLFICFNFSFNSNFDFFISRLSIFEKNPPQILMPDVVYTDLKKPILVHIKDDESSIKNVQIILHKDDNTSAMVIADEKISNLKDITLQVALPKFGYKENVKSFVLEVIAKDSSFWNFF